MKGKAAMVEYVGFDVSKEETAFGVMDKDGSCPSNSVVKPILLMCM